MLRCWWGDMGDALFGGDVLELNGRVVVGTATGRTQAVHGRLDVVVAELAYLATGSVGPRAMRDESSTRARPTHLVATGTRAEVSVRQVELLDAEGTALVLVVVNELVIVEAGHGGRVSGGGVCVQCWAAQRRG
jgi:hypothetical protein